MKSLKIKLLKNLSLLAGGVSLSAVSLSAASPLVSFCDGAQLMFNGSAEVRSESNIFLLDDPSQEVDDIVFVVSPGLELNLGKKDAPSSVVINVREDIKFYNDNSDLDDNLTTVTLGGSFDTALLSYSGSAYSVEVASNVGTDNTTPTLIETNITGFNNSLEYRLNQKTAVSVGFDVAKVGYLDTYYDTDNTDPNNKLTKISPLDNKKLSVPVNFYYTLNQKLDLTLGYRYRFTQLEANAGEFTDNLLTIGVRNEIAPKLKGSFKIGVQNRDYEEVNASSDLSVTMLADLVYEFSPLFRLTINGLSDFDAGTSSTYASVNNNRIGLVADYQLSTMLAASASASYNHGDYTGDRTDELTSLGLAVKYNPNEFVSVSTGYEFSQNSSDKANRSYISNVLYLKAALRY
jgi:hypothetical protein